VVKQKITLVNNGLHDCIKRHFGGLVSNPYDWCVERCCGIDHAHCWLAKAREVMFAEGKVGTAIFNLTGW
jgi:hypothetical protein